VARVVEPTYKLDGLNPHSEFALDTMREFFQRRPWGALLDAFREQDVDHNGKIDLGEFIHTLRQLGICNLNDKDMAAAFKACDMDGNGEIELEEFYRSFRTDRFKREDFFWGKARPHDVITKAERLSLAQQLGADIGTVRGRRRPALAPRALPGARERACSRAPRRRRARPPRPLHSGLPHCTPSQPPPRA
jgi:hypothetical protein